MIYDTQNHLLQYKGMTNNMDTAVEYLIQKDLTSLSPGKYPILGDSIFLLIQEPKLCPRSTAKWESHQNYIDIQYLIKGEESIGFQKTDSLEIAQHYSEVNDIAFYQDNGKGFFVNLRPGSFVVCFPTDAHMPLVGTSHSLITIKKAVVKVKLT